MVPALMKSALNGKEDFGVQQKMMLQAIIRPGVIVQKVELAPWK